jgi:beta-mannosidase
MKVTATLLALTLMAVAGGSMLEATPLPRAHLSLDEDWSFRQIDREEWYPAEVPGVVHLDLQRNGLIADPFMSTVEESIQWIGKTDWEYRRKFSVPRDVLERKNVELVFDGLDTYAEVYLNDELVLEAINMYRWWRVPVTGKLKESGNELRVVFRSPIVRDLPRVGESGYVLPAANDKEERTSPYTRKAPYSFGWDWGPRFVTAGIWKPVRIEAWEDVRLTDVFIRQTEHSDDTVELEADVEILGSDDAAGSAKIEILVDGETVATENVSVSPGAKIHTVSFEIDDPRLWWPNGLGEQPLYTVTTKLRREGETVDETSSRIGLRTIELVREEDKWGKSFKFVVNGVPVFAKGANWIPADSFLPRVTRERLEQRLGSAKRANFNMLRVWAGGIYESDDFYDLADEMGLLIWEDFHFSTSLYPADEAFLANVAVEAEHAIRRLRNRPSLALWCGNNEVEGGWEHWGWKHVLPNWLFNDYEKLFHELLPSVVAKFDPTRSYWPSSPSANREADPGSPDNGDMHYWGVWHAAEPFSKYEETPTRFMSEYGFQSFPELETIKSFVPPWEEMAIDSRSMLAHQKHPRGNQLIREYMLRDYPEPKDFPSFLYVSQVLQAEGIKLGAEYHRRSMPRTMGTLYWQLNDCWPVASWSSIDYYGRWKALQYYAKRFFENILVSTAEEDGAIQVYVVSDLTEVVRAALDVRLLHLDGETLWSTGKEIVVQPLTSASELSIAKNELLGDHDPSEVFLRVEITADGETLSANNRFFMPPKDLALARPTLETTVRSSDAGFEITVETDTLARNVRLSYGPDDGFFTDNYFDLLPGAPLTLTWESETDVTLEDFQEGLVVESIVDAFGVDTGSASD